MPRFNNVGPVGWEVQVWHEVAIVYQALGEPRPNNYSPGPGPLSMCPFGFPGYYRQEADPVHSMLETREPVELRQTWP